MIERRTRRAVPWLALGGAGALLLAGLLIAWPAGDLVAGFAGLFLLIVGAALLIPGAIVLAVPFCARGLGAIAGPLGRMAANGITAALSRTGLAVIALTVALSATVGVGVMIDSFRGTVDRWLQRTLVADFYLSPPDRVAARHYASLPDGLAPEVRAIPGVDAISTGWRVEVRGPKGPTPLFVLDPAPQSFDALRLKPGAAEDARARVRAGEAVLVSEPWAQRHDAAVGTRIELATDRGQREVAIAGIYYDYNTDRGIVLMHRDLYERWWDTDRISSIGVFVAPGADRAAVAERIRSVAAAAAEPVIVRDSGAIRARSLEVFDQTFAITTVLRLLALGVAFVGVLTALLALQIERRRELGILRAMGATPGQVRAHVGLQTTAIGLLAGLFALPLGLALAEVLIHVINRRAFGWTIVTDVPPDVLVEAVALSVVAALVAGAWPAWQAGRVAPAHVLRAE